MISSSRTSSILLAIALAACSARGGGGGGGFDTDASTTGDSTTTMTGACTSLCARVAATSGCTGDMASCVTGCAALVSNAACASQASAFTSCAGSSAIVCSGDTPSFTDCMSQQTALISCITTAPPPDASTPIDAVVPPDVTITPDVTVTPDVPTQPDVVRPDVPVDATTAQALCAAVCEHVAASPGCSALSTSCASMCGALSSIPATCSTSLNNYLGCLASATIDCSSGSPQAPACASVQSALTTCITGGTRDSGVDVPTTGDPTSSCTTATWGGTSRECGWRRGGTFSCTPGRSYTIGCNSTTSTAPTACTTAIGSCSGDPVMRVCSGTTTCSSAAALTSVDDTCGTCPVGTVICPTSGQVTVLTGDFDNATPGTCTVALR